MTLIPIIHQSPTIQPPNHCPMALLATISSLALYKKGDCHFKSDSHLRSSRDASCSSHQRACHRPKLNQAKGAGCDIDLKAIGLIGIGQPKRPKTFPLSVVTVTSMKASFLSPVDDHSVPRLLSKALSAPHVSLLFNNERGILLNLNKIPLPGIDIILVLIYYRIIRWLRTVFMLPYGWTT